MNFVTIIKVLVVALRYFAQHRIASNIEDMATANEPQDATEVPDSDTEVDCCIVLPDVDLPPALTLVNLTYEPKVCWIFDNGHGKHTMGKRSPVLPDGRQLLEYEFNRRVVENVIISASMEGLEVVDLVPDVDKVGNFLKGRVDRANAVQSKLPRVFVSVHANAAPDDDTPDGWNDGAEGIETWHHHENEQGKYIAGIFQKELIEEFGGVNRGLKSRPEKQFYVLRNTEMTSILLEIKFFTHTREVRELLDPDTALRAARACVRAMLRYEARL